MTPSQPMDLAPPNYSPTSTSTVVAQAQSRRPSIIAMAPASVRPPKPTNTSTNADNGIGQLPGPSRHMIQYGQPPVVPIPIPIPRAPAPTQPAPNPPPPAPPPLTPRRPQDQAEDLSMRPPVTHDTQFLEEKPMNKRIQTLLQFCDIVLKYVRYPEAFEVQKPKTAAPRKRKAAAARRRGPNKAKPPEGNLEGLEPPAPVAIRKPRQRKANTMKEQLIKVEPLTSSSQNAVPIVPFIKEEPLYEEAFSDYYKFDDPLDMPLPPEPPTRTIPVPKAAEKPKKPAARRRGGTNKPVPVIVIEEEETNGAGPPDKVANPEKPITQSQADTVEKPVNGVGENKHDSSSSSSSSSNGAVENESPNGEEIEYEEDGGEITCFCGEAYGGRAMIECESCLQWLHLKCARISNKHIPDTFVCNACQKPSKRRRRPSGTAKRKRGPNRRTTKKAAKNALTNGNGPAAPSNAPVPPPPEANLHEEVHENGHEEMDRMEPDERKDSVIKNGRGRRKSSPFSHLKASLTGMSNGNSAPGSSDDSVFSNGNGPVTPKVKKVKTEHLDFTPSPKPVPRRRPTINSASSGLYNDSSLLPLALQFHLNLYNTP